MEFSIKPEDVLIAREILRTQAEEMELDQGILVEHLKTVPREWFLEAAKTMNWHQIYMTFEDDTLLVIQGRGPNLQFTKDLRELQVALCNYEITVRELAGTPEEAPWGNGMDEEGNQLSPDS